MYAMVDRYAIVHSNLDQFYMASLMTAPTVLFELLQMGSTYERRRFNGLVALNPLARIPAAASA
jgi:hypothetical protein